MKKNPALFILILIISAQAHAQLSLTKMVGKNADKYKLGYCVFAYYDFPLTEEGNKSIRLELMDLAYFPSKIGDNARAYISIKLGYKNIFSETKTGVYVEP